MTEEIVQVYDQLAEHYDERYTDETCRLENMLVTALVRDTVPAGGHLIDVGCGTGLALELELADPERYLGVDPSAGMLVRFAAKFPHDVHAMQMSFQEWWEHHMAWTFDGLISLFGSPSYLEDKYTEKLFELAPNLVLMHYVEGYWPDYESKPTTADESRDKAKELTLELGGEVLHLNHFQICVLKRS